MRDEQNIKRRVYDALNVLIAADVISKRGKIVQISRNSHLTGKCLKKDNWTEVKTVEKEIVSILNT